jgi:multidrug efflux system outer membrane protein
VIARAGAIALGIALAGCAIGPNYERPAIGSPDAHRGALDPAETASIADLAWWDVFEDPVLRELVIEAIRSGRDLRVAAARVEQASAQVGVSRSELLPQIGYDGSAGREQLSDFLTPTPNRSRTGELFVGTVNLAWEIDVWGRIRRATEASRAELYREEAFRRGVLLSLVSAVAQTYFELRELDLELEIAVRTVSTFRETRDLFQRQFDGGVASKLEVQRAEAALAQTEAQVPELERLIVERENALCVLLGRHPGPIPRGAALEAIAEPPEVPAGVPSTLLERRPDVVAAEQAVVATNARIGQSIADFFPRIGLTAAYGSQSLELREFAAAGSSIWSLAAVAAGPLFQGGNLYYRWRFSKEAFAEAVSAYEQSVLVAFQEVSNTLTAREKLALARADQARAVAALQESVRLSLVRYRGGLSNYVEVLDSQQQLFPAENALARIELARRVALVQLYRALGGGWGVPEEQWGPVPWSP